MSCACLLQHLSHLLSEDLQGLPLTRIQARMFASKFVSGAAQVFVHSCCTLDKTFDLVLGVYLFFILIAGSENGQSKNSRPDSC